MEDIKTPKEHFEINWPLKKLPPAAGGNLLKVRFADVNPGIPGVTLMIIDGVGAPGVVVEDPGTVEVAAEKESSKFKFILYVIGFLFLVYR